MNNTVQTDETPRKQGLWQRILTPGTSPQVGAESSKAARATVAIAALPSAASLVWTAWSLIDMIPAPLPVGLAAGVVLDVALVSAVAIAWISPRVAKAAKVTGWLIALVAAALVGYHAYTILPVLAGLGLVPLVAKGLWHLALNARLARAAAEAAQAKATRKEAKEKAQREAELSTELTHEERRQIAEKLRLAAFEEELAEAEVRLDDAQAERVHRLKLAAIRREAEVVKERIELAWEINAVRSTQFALPAGEAPDDLSSLPAPQASQGDAAGHLAHLGFGSDQGVSPGRPGGDPVVADPPLRDLMAYLGAAGEAASVRGAAKELRVAPITIRRWRDKAEAQGLDVSALKSSSQ